MGVSFVDHIPVSIGSPQQFACVAKALRDAHFDEENICRILKLKEMCDLGQAMDVKVDFSNVVPQLQILIRLFMSLELVARSEVESVFDATTVEAFLSLGLLGTGEFGEDEFYARLLLYPVAGFWIASDRHSTPASVPFEPSPDIVFPAIYEGTLKFLRLLPNGESRDGLDLCAGTGVGALVLSRTIAHCVSADITERATQFSRFNRALNNCGNVEAVCGDLYDAVADQMFDRIVAHPPYVPSIGLRTIWRDGGATGELLVRRIVEGLPTHLRKGGIFCCMTQGLDTEEGRFEERVRSWLNESSGEFDIIFACEKELTPQKVLDILAGRGSALGQSGVEELTAEFERAKILQMPYGALFLRRTGDSDSGAEPWTVRTRLGKETTGSDVEAAFAMHDQSSKPGFALGLSNVPVRLAPRLELKVTYVVHEGTLAPAKYVFETDKPFLLSVQIDEWAVPSLTRLNGKVTVAEVYEEARSQEEFPDNFKLEDFLKLISRGIEGGLFVLPDSVGADKAAQETE